MKLVLKRIGSLLAGLIAVTVMSLPGQAQAAASSNAMNIRFSPLGALVGSYNLNLDIAFTNSWTVGPEIQYANINSSSNTSNISLTGYAFGARFNWFANGTYTDGLYLGPSITFSNYTGKFANTNGTSVSSSANGPAIGLLVGYGWFWDSFNIMLGIGGKTRIGGSDLTIVDSNGTTRTNSNYATGIDGEFSLGWTF